MPEEHSVTLTVRHNINTGDTTITGGNDDGGDVDIYEGKSNRITWNAAGHTGRWGFDGIEITPPGSFVVESRTADQIVVTEPGGMGTGQHAYQLRFRNVVTLMSRLQDPLSSNMITKKAGAIVK